MNTIIHTAAKPTHYVIADGRVWDIAAAAFIASAPKDACLVTLQADGQVGDAASLRRTLEFRGLAVGLELLTLEEAKAAKIQQIDAETSAAILAGFDYEVNGALYHFSYDVFDQQNFSDTANMCQLALAGTPDLPASVTWNAYTVPGGKLVQQVFDAASFLGLYTAGAMLHKAAKMAAGGERKAKVAAAETVGDVEAV